MRFVIPGAVVHYRKAGLFASSSFTEDFYPVRDISCGGICFLAQVALKIDTKLTLKIEVPGEDAPLVISGRVCWISPNPEKSYKYQTGIQFAPYGRQKGENPPELLEMIRALEERFRG